MGNTLASWLRDEQKVQFDSEAGANLDSLEGLIDTAPYLRKGSDIVALMVLEHQVGMINRLTEAERYFQNSFRVSRSLYPDLEEATTLAELTGTPLSVATSYAEKIVGYMLFRDEADLPEGGIDGDPSFQEAFQKNRRPSKASHALKDFHLGTRLFKNRCSYLIYSDAFRALHPHSEMPSTIASGQSSKGKMPQATSTILGRANANAFKGFSGTPCRISRKNSSSPEQGVALLKARQ